MSPTEFDWHLRAQDPQAVGAGGQEGDAGVTRASRQTLDSDTCLARAAVELYALPRAGVASPVHSSCQHIARLVCERICPHRAQDIARTARCSVVDWNPVAHDHRGGVAGHGFN